MLKTPTPHINAKLGDFAKTVIMPGDPNRAKFIAKNFLTDAKLVNNVRGVQGYTGTYNGKKVSVMASGMGNASMGIYSYELFSAFGVESIIRVGSCGANSKDLPLKSIIIATCSITKTNYKNMFEHKINCVECSKKLAKHAKIKAKSLNFAVFEGNVYSTDTFYDEENQAQIFKENNCLGVEMESASLYYNAKLLNKEALTLCSVSDNLITGESLSAKERETSFCNMIKLALEMI